MKILHCFNLANDGWSICVGLRKIGVDAHLMIQRPSHVSSLPQLEDGDFDVDSLGDPYNPNWDAFTWDMPSWVHVWNAEKQWYPLSRTIKWLRLLNRIGKYDLVIGHAPFAKIALMYERITRKPYILLDAGWGRYLPENKKGYRAARWGYAHAQKIFFTNVDMEDMLRSQGYDQLEYSPFAIDTNRYSPLGSSEKVGGTVFFHPARQDWLEKGNDRFIRALARYARRNPSVEGILTEWYQDKSDLEASKELIKNLGISNKVHWIQLMPKNKLVELYRQSTAVFDQFIFGAFGTCTPEAMSCGVPVVGYANPNLWLRHHPTIPPVLNARTEDEIYEAMIQLEDTEFRKRLGWEGRNWILENCADTVIARRQLACYEQVLAA